MFRLDATHFSFVSKARIDSLMKCNSVLQKHGLVLYEAQAKELLKTQNDSITETGRVEFKSTIIEDIMYMFCDSQHFTKYDYVSQLNELIEIFYYYKEATDGLLSDEDIIKYLYLSFEGACQGSLSWLGDNQLQVLLDNLQDGKEIFEATRYGTY